MLERPTATKVRIKDLLNASLIRKPGWELSYFNFNNIQVLKINLIALIVSIDKNQLVVDDGTGSIIVKTFNQPKNLAISKPVLIIGSLRESNTEKYVVAEILNVLNTNDWLKIRKFELINIKTPKKEELEKIKPKENSNIYETILNTIRILDSGEGVDINEIVKTSKIENCESKINNLLLEGELFEIKQGKIKILE